MILYSQNRLEDVYKHPQNHPNPDGSACRLRAVFNKIAVLGDLPFQVVGKLNNFFLNTKI